MASRPELQQHPLRLICSAAGGKPWGAARAGRPRGELPISLHLSRSRKRTGCLNPCQRWRTAPPPFLITRTGFALIVVKRSAQRMKSIPVFAGPVRPRLPRTLPSGIKNKQSVALARHPAPEKISEKVCFFSLVFSGQQAIAR